METAVIFSIAKYLAVVAATVATLSTFAVIKPYWRREKYLKWHLWITSIATLMLVWLTVGGFTLFIWYRYPLTATILSFIAYGLFFIGIWFSYLHRESQNQ